jgi:hypothetical protein
MVSESGPTQPPWPPLIASDGELVTPFFNGRVVVEDVQEDRFTTTVTLRSMPRPETGGC